MTPPFVRATHVQAAPRPAVVLGRPTYDNEEYNAALHVASGDVLQLRLGQGVIAADADAARTQASQSRRPVPQRRTTLARGGGAVDMRSCSDTSVTSL